MEIPLDERDDNFWEKDCDFDRQEDVLAAAIEDFSEVLLARDFLKISEDDLQPAIDRLYNSIKDGTTRQDLIQMVISFLYASAQERARGRFLVMQRQLSEFDRGHPVAFIQGQG